MPVTIILQLIDIAGSIVLLACISAYSGKSKGVEQ